KPDWLKIRISTHGDYQAVNELVQKHRLHTICESGDCPNKGECWSHGTATFMILGNICTRGCKFCNVATGKPLPVNPAEPEEVAESISVMKLKYAVVTSVDRDDLPDYGSSFWAEAIRAIKQKNPTTNLEVLIPDFQGNMDYLQKVIDARPDVISHNIETVSRLTPLVRSKAQYNSSLKVLDYISKSGIVSKSGIMLGLGETEAEVLETMDDLLAAGCQILTIGQYLQPTRNNYPVIEYITPQQFEKLKQIGKQKGFKFIESAPLVRSSYHAEKFLESEHKN
ncbi:MAG: lipoyl synthase, partial [Bacteroidota bacterium]|nr:lipoyl synthase [Bacteroidota bacterium]